ncbi:hypothetical protein KBD18_02085 [Patescibacteria group bacterium]|nr:hypothetical protein [Patescibacteria group bacterium]
MLTQRLSGLQPPCEELGEIFSCSITSLASDLAAAGLALMETAAHERPLSPQIDRPRFRARFVFRQAGISTAVAKPDEASGLMTLCTKSFWRVRGVLVPNEEMGCRSLILVLDTRVTAQNNKGKPAKLPRAPGVSRGQPRERIRPTMDIRFSDRRLHIIPSAKR